jgi:hypothetical protein
MSTETAATRWRKKPIVITAIQFTGANVGEIWDAFGTAGIYGPTEKNPDELILTTVHGDPAPARAGDWIIPDAKPDTFYPCKPEVFATSYESAAAIEDDPATRLLALPLPPNNSGAVTVGGYLTALLTRLWADPRAFHAEHPFGAGSEEWADMLYKAAAAASDGTESPLHLVRAAIAKLGEVTP